MMKSTSLHSLQTTEQTIIFVLSLWLALITVVSYFGFLTMIPLPAIALLVMIGIAIPLTIYFYSSAFQAYIRSIPPANLVALQIWRILAGFVFLEYGKQNLLPETFVMNAGYGDLAVGLLVPILLIVGKGTRSYIAFHIFGLLDFILAVGTGLTFSLLEVPLMETIATFPLALIPLFGVPISGVSSVLAIDALVRKTNN